MYRSSRRIAIYKSQDPRLRKQFGGALLKNSNAKKARPISTKHAMHVVLQSTQAKGAWSFRNHKNWKRISDMLSLQARRYGVQLREVVNGGDHLQLILKIKNRELFNSFVRAVSGIIAMMVTGAAKTRALKHKFWDFRPWSRVVALIRNYSVQGDEVVQKYLVEARIFNFKEAPA